MRRRRPFEPDARHQRASVRCGPANLTSRKLPWLEVVEESPTTKVKFASHAEITL
jgi:hypothetical protein